MTHMSLLHAMNLKTKTREKNMPVIALLHFFYLYFPRPLRSAYDLNIFYTTGHCHMHRMTQYILFRACLVGFHTLPHFCATSVASHSCCGCQIVCHTCGRSRLVNDYDKWGKRRRKCGLPQPWLQPNTCLTWLPNIWQSVVTNQICLAHARPAYGLCGLVNTLDWYL